MTAEPPSVDAAAVERIGELFTFAYPRMQAQETQLRASLAVALEEWVKGEPPPKFRTTRRILIRNALAPLQDTLTKSEFDRLAQSLSLVFGIESIVVLKDAWSLEGNKAARVTRWAANALVRAAIADSTVARAKREPITKKLLKARRANATPSSGRA